MDLPESVELTQLRAENAQLRAKIGGASMPIPALPWWKSGATITTLTAIVVASVPSPRLCRDGAEESRACLGGSETDRKHSHLLP